MFICILFWRENMKKSFEEIISGYEKVNMLTALREMEGVIQGKCNRRMVECLCDCGNTTVISIDHYKRSKIVSCGCHHKKRISEAAKTHGLSKTPEYKVWQGMKGRCHNPNHADYPMWGGRGVEVSKEWFSFESFITDMGNRPTPEYTLERIDNSKGYCKDNCKWATRKEQRANVSKWGSVTRHGVML